VADGHDVEPFWLAGKATTGDEVLDVFHPYDGSLVASVSVPTRAQVEEAVVAAVAVAEEATALPAFRRAAALDHICEQLLRRRETVANLITAESGKPLKWSRVEVERSAAVFRWASEEARRWSGELQRLDTDPRSTGRLALTRRFPKGPVLGIAPFNFPLNLVAHKVAPAIAVGAPIILKPAPATPLSSLLLGELMSETGLPAGILSVLPVDNEVAAGLVADDRLPVVTFTGSGPVGWRIRESVPRKHVTLELGGNAAAVICRDWSSPEDLDRAASRIAVFANYQAGQSCISVQRVFVERPLYEEFLNLLVLAVRQLRTGDPYDEMVDVGPLIDEAAAKRVEEWVQEAVGGGARLLTGGRRDRATLEPTVLVDVPPEAKVACEEVFGPVVIVSAVDDPQDAFNRVNASRYGLQVGVLTRDVELAFRAHRELQVGGVVIGDVPSFRADQMPYGGVKDSGMGREGVHSAMLDFTHERVLVLTGLPL
jgi:aldehyde dehydrogenase (NAD+)